MDTTSNIRIKRLGEPESDAVYTRENVNFAGDCVYALQRHFVDRLLSGDEFESGGEDYLRTLRVVEAIYEADATRSAVRLDHESDLPTW